MRTSQVSLQEESWQTHRFPVRIENKWSEHFARLEAMFLAKNFTVPIEPVQNSDVVTYRPFITPEQQTTGVTCQKQPTSQTQPTGQREMKKATQPVEAPGAVTATQPVESPGADPETLHTGQDASLLFAVDRPEMQPPGPASKIVSSGRSVVQPPDPTGHPTATKKHTSILPVQQSLLWNRQLKKEMSVTGLLT